MKYFGAIQKLHDAEKLVKWSFPLLRNSKFKIWKWFDFLWSAIYVIYWETKFEEKKHFLDEF